MRLRPCIVGAVLAAFVTTTAVPGPQVVAHSHAGGDHDHAHAFLAHEAHAHLDHDDEHESEVVFGGDCGTIEGTGSSFDQLGPTRRWGVDFEARYQLTRWLAADYDLSWADPR